ncbi:ALBINO3-like protein 2, chloroplastic [Silene latifolia]|uniref:ALBINO3-like protein 2, chloroplastic n=1 Tax=Silene latifolia TaxID=37657 RepID=UPI003D76E8BA
MATPRLISALFRRYHHRKLLSLLNPISRPPSTYHFAPSLATTSFRFFSSHSPDSLFPHEFNSVTESDPHNLDFLEASQVSAAVHDGLLDSSSFPVCALVSLLDGYHQLSGLPWWIVIASSTVALRVTLLPVLILQLQKLKHIGEAFPKLPPPLPPPFSGKRFVDQFSLFRRERKAIGCPSFLWFLTSHTIQIPCFILWMISIRRMSLDEFPGFDTGGTLWFQNLSESSSGVLGSIFPFLVAGLHFCNIQISFRGSSIDKQTGLLQFLAKWYRKYLELLTVPLLFGAFYVPQGSLVYWVTNSSLTLIQQVCLQHPPIREKLGLVNKQALQEPTESEKELDAIIDAPMKKGSVSAFDLSPLELVDRSLAYLSTRKTEKAVLLLRLAVEKDPDCYRAWTILGDVMVTKGLFNEASEYSECAISKICLLEEPYDAEAVDFLVQASIIAGGALYRQGKVAEALVHFERVRNIKEPDYPAAKGRYYEGLVVYASVLLNEGRRDEAVQYLRLAIAFDPQYSELLKNLNLEKDADDFLGDLTSSRRADY